MFTSPNEFWVDAERRAKIAFDKAAGELSFSVDGTAAALSPTELGYAEGVTTTPTASKFALHTSSGQLSVRRPIIADGATYSLDATQSGGLVVLDKSDGTVGTLPPAAAGLWYDFVITATPASVGHKVICTSGDFIVGSIFLDDGDSGLTTTAQAFNGSTHLAINIDAVTDGWLAGGFFRLTAISDTQWVINGHLLHTGNVASPAATS